MTHSAHYPIGTLGQPWQEREKEQWYAQQVKQRSYNDDVVTQVHALADNFEVIEYGTLHYNDDFVLYALKHKQWQAGKPIALITGGVHGYETSGVHGALAFAKEVSQSDLDTFNILIIPCISPWGYETINRWNPEAIDPNRSFYDNSPAQESQKVREFLAPYQADILLHIDLHETTDSDNSEFRPALAARDGVVNTNWNIPDGFYLVADTQRPQAEFQRAIIEGVRQVTHIAPADDNGELIGVALSQFGVIEYAGKSLGLCMGLTDAPYVTTTEVYPDSPRSDAQNCIDAQVASITSALNFVKAL